MIFKFYSNIKIVKGALRTSIMDLQNGNYHLLSNEYVIFSKSNEFNQNDCDKEILEFLKDLEMIYQINNLTKNFIDLKEDYDTPGYFSNVIIEIEGNPSISQLHIDKLSQFGVKAIQLIFNYLSNLKELFEIVDLFKTSSITTIEVIIKNMSESIGLQELKKIQNFSTRVKLIAVFNSKLQKKIIEPSNVNIITLTSSFDIKSNFISRNTFYCNIDLYLEAKNRNTYLNKKLFIDKEGNVKNSPESTEYISTIDKIETFTDSIFYSKISKYWIISKDLIDVCKHCEFRYMCVDNRIPLQRNEKEWYFENECNYNPYIVKWEGEEGYMTLTECGIQSNKSGFEINSQKLSAINKKLWGDV